MFTDTLSAIEVGTTRTVYLIGKPDRDGRIRVIAAAANDMTGLRKGQIVNSPNARTGIVTAVEGVRGKASLPDLNWLVFSGGNVRSDLVVHSVVTNGAVTSSDIHDAVTAATNGNGIDSRTILHAVPQDYVVKDGSSERTVQDAKQMKADSLQANVLLVHCDATALTDVHTVVQDAHLPVRGHVFSAACAARAVLTDDQRLDGTLLINLGGGTTSFVLYSGGVLRQAASIPVGGDHVTNDLSRAFGSSFRAAEALKRNHSSALVGGAHPEDTVPVAASGMLDRERRVSLNAVNMVVNARLDELFRVVLDQVGDAGFIEVVLVGGGALQKGVTELAKSVFRRDCSVGVIRDGTHFGEEGEQDVLFATAYGALHIARDEIERNQELQRGGTLFDRLFGKASPK